MFSCWLVKAVQSMIGVLPFIYCLGGLFLCTNNSIGGYSLSIVFSNIAAIFGVFWHFVNMSIRMSQSLLTFLLTKVVMPCCFAFVKC